MAVVTVLDDSTVRLSLAAQPVFDKRRIETVRRPIVVQRDVITLYALEIGDLAHRLTERIAVFVVAVIGYHSVGIDTLGHHHVVVGPAHLGDITQCIADPGDAAVLIQGISRGRAATVGHLALQTCRADGERGVLKRGAAAFRA